MLVPTISIIIPVHNGGQGFEACLRSIRWSSRQPDEIIVIADGDTDGSWQVAQSFGAKTFRYEKAGGPARARNRGARLASGDILFFVDADVTVHPETIERVASTFAQHANVDALIGSYDDQPGDSGFLSQYKNLFHHYTHQRGDEAAFTFWGACGAIRGAVFHTVGGFDEGYRKPCIEDIELGYRLKQAGYQIRLQKDVQVKHLKRWQPLSLLRAEVFYRAIPWADLILSDRHFNTDLNLNYTNRLSVVLVFGLVAILFASSLAPWLLLVSAVLSLTLLLINRDVYQFFYQKRGFWFTLRVIPWHWFYFLYGGAAFAYSLLRHSLNQHNLPILPIPQGISRTGQLFSAHNQ